MARQRIWNLSVVLFIQSFSAVFTAPLSVDSTPIENPAKYARSYSSYASSNGAVRDPYSDNFDAMYNTMDLANLPRRQKVAITLPNPPGPPSAPRPRPSPDFGQFEKDPNQGPKMPLPPRPPYSFGAMDITVNFPKYTPNVDDAFYDSDSGMQPMTYVGGGTTGKGTSYGTGDMDSGSGAYVDKYARDLEGGLWK